MKFARGQLALFDDLPASCVGCGRPLKSEAAKKRRRGRNCWSKLTADERAAWIQFMKRDEPRA